MFRYAVYNLLNLVKGGIFLLLIYELLIIACVVLVIACLGFSVLFFIKANRTNSSFHSRSYFNKVLWFGALGSFVLILSLVVLSTAVEIALAL